MNHPLLLIILSLLVCVGCEDVQEVPPISINREIEGYYWRQYYGYTPHDAVPGGVDRFENPTYIGQVLHKSFIVPGEINASDKQIHYTWGYKSFSTPKNIKILCSNHPEQLQWISTDKKTIKNLTDKHLILGGYEAGVGENYIGRKSVNDTTLVGKILLGDKAHGGFHGSRMDKPLQFNSFEILTFNPYIALRNLENAKILIGENGEVEYDFEMSGCPENIINLNYKNGLK